MRIARLLVAAGMLCVGCGHDPGSGRDLGGLGGQEDLAGGGGGADGGTHFNTDAACAQVSAEATLGKGPVDIIFVIDNSGSMTDEIQAVENNINQNFATIIGQSGLDYRVIMVSHNGIAAVDQSICVTMPLSGNPTCSPPPFKPVNTKNFFHYSLEIGSHNLFGQFLKAYSAPDPNGAAPGGASDWLRPAALKVFIFITDDSATDYTADSFEQQLFMKNGQFGTAMKRNYVFHSIIGLKENNPATTPWVANDPLQSALCTKGGGAVNNGLEYQKMSVRSGGLRFPICEYASFDAVFKAVASGVVAGAQVACDFDVPAAPMGEKIDLKTVVLNYTPMGMGTPTLFTQVADANACGPTSFYIANGKIVLCPQACATIQGDATAKVSVFFDCEAPIG